MLGRLLRRWRQPAQVPYQASCQNVFHCTVQRSASQWLSAILADPRIQLGCGLRPQRDDMPGGVDPRKLTERTYVRPFPEGTIVSPLYVSYDGFASIPKPRCYRAFFVMRDPRDVVVSWYFSVKQSHAVQGEIARIRPELQRLSEWDGLCYALDFLRDFGLFAAQASWAAAPARDSNVALTRFETLIGVDQAAEFARLLRHCDIQVPNEVLMATLETYRFERLSGRPAGTEDRDAHYRKGLAGDWRNHFDDRLHARFVEAAPDVLSLWGYS